MILSRRVFASVCVHERVRERERVREKCRSFVMRESEIQICLNSRVRNAIKKRSIQRKENVYIIVYNSIEIGRSVTAQSQMKQWCSVFIVIPVVD